MVEFAEETITIEHCDAVAIVRFNPALDGTIGNKGAASLADGIAKLLDHRDVNAIVITGSQPGVFIRHANLDQIVRAGAALLAGQANEDDFLRSPFQRLCGMLDAAEKPVIAAINGTCMGGGLEIALACTMRIASRQVEKIGLPEIRLGIPPGAGGPQRLARLVGSHRARLFVLEGRVIDAETALTLGVIDEITDDAVARAVSCAEGYARRSPSVVAEILRQTHANDTEDLADNAIGFARCLTESGTVSDLRAVSEGGADIDSLP
jgi:enoyl-CoA hydratase/carnithine racemase